MDIVNEQYWLAYAKKLIDEVDTRLNDAAVKISTLVGIFWAMYTAAFAIGSSLKKLEEPPYILWLLVLPIPLLIISYVSSLWVQMPSLSTKGVDPRNPAQVMNYYNRATKWKKLKIGFSLLFLFLSASSLSYALIYANFTHEKTDKKQIVDVIQVSNKLFFAGDLPNKTIVKYKILKDQKVIINDSTLVIQDNHFDRTINMLPMIGELYVSIIWKEKNDKTVEHTFTKKIVWNK